MSDPVCRVGEQEAFKLLIHLGLFSLAVTCGLYSVTAWLARQDRHLAVNAAGYTAIALFEGQQIRRHVEGLR